MGVARRWVIALAVVAAASPASLGQTTLTPEAKEAVLGRVGATLASRAFVTGVDFSRWGEWREEGAGAIERAETPAAFARAVNGVLRRFGVSHLRLIAPTAAARPAGGGAPGHEREGGSGRSSWVFGSTEVGGGGGVGVEGETLEWLDEGCVVLRVPTFDAESYSRENVERLMSEAGRAGYLILDLRNNGGGEVRSMNHLLGMFLRSGTAIGAYVGRRQVEAFERETGEREADAVRVAGWMRRPYTVLRNPGPVYGGKVAVLINRGSASASEIVAAALRDHAGAALVGSRSAGQVLLSNQFPLAEGFRLQVPLSDYVTRRGVRLEGSPLVPHVVVEGPAGDRLRAVRAAAELLRSGL